ncbi:MAG TPA: hypothetical protein VLT45_25445 [Kofleriaceae bacterium]|nr:hypothetical protein [Kofleriaceae bacterium]
MLRSLVIVGVMAASAAAEVSVYESRDDKSITEGDTIINVDPDVAYTTALDYAKWTAIFPDIKQVIVTKRQGDEARVTFVHVDGNRDNVHFRNTPQARMIWFEDTGGRAEVWAEIVFVPGTQAGTTRVHSRVYANVHGVAGWFVGDDTVKSLRAKRVRHDLHDLQTYFTKK